MLGYIISVFSKYSLHANSVLSTVAETENEEILHSLPGVQNSAVFDSKIAKRRHLSVIHLERYWIKASILSAFHPLTFPVLRIGKRLPLFNLSGAFVLLT